MRKFAYFLFLLCIFAPGLPAYALDQTAMIENLQRNMEQLQKTVGNLQSTINIQNEVIREQGLRISAVEGHSVLVKKPTHAAASRERQEHRGINPEIGVTASVEAKLTENTADSDGNDTIALKELEIGLGQSVTPFSRLDAILAFNDNLEDQNVDIEEAYYSHWGLPLDFRGQIGKFRARVGKQNLLPRHALDTADYALVLRDFFGDEGLSSSGARISHDIPGPWDSPIELTGEILRGNNGNSFSGVSRRPIFNTHLKTLLETNESSDLELGWTTLFGDENPAVFTNSFDDGGNPVSTPIVREKGSDRYGVKIFGADATWNWRLSEARAVKFQNELYFQNRGTTRNANENPWGFYSLLNYRFHPRFSSGVRFDYLEPLSVTGEHNATHGISPYITFHQSEFANFRLQFSHTEPAEANAASNNEIFLTANISIETHEHTDR